jgi:metal-responsive CopG/Arc/MetJ family transcriptional regulator
MEGCMPISTVNISFQKELLGQIDRVAAREARTRSELIREAVRLYIDRKKEWDLMFTTGRKIGLTLDMREEDVMGEIKKYRKVKQKTT